ncbi:MAG: DUF1552 domain-containing protein [Planctomycetota bacterium]
MIPSQPHLDRRHFLRGTGLALSLPWLETFAGDLAANAEAPRRLACFYMPDGVPMPLEHDPAHDDWSWFPLGEGRDFRFTKCMEPLESLREEVTVLSGLSHPAARSVHGHSNADQFLTGAPIGGGGTYRNTVSLDQVFASHVDEQTRLSSLVMSTDGGIGTPRGAQTMSFSRTGRAIPAEHQPKRIFDMLFVKQSDDAAKRLQLNRSALDELLEDARQLNRTLSQRDQTALQDYMQSVRDTEVSVQKAQRWLDIPLPSVDADHLQLDITPEDPDVYLRTMFDLIYLAFKTDSTRTATYQLGRENGVGVSDYLARAIGFNLTHQLSHQTKEPGGWRNFGVYCQFLNGHLARFAKRLKSSAEIGGQGNMLDNTVVLFGSASSGFHLSRNYPLILAGGRNMGFRHGRFLKFAASMDGQSFIWQKNGREPWQREMTHEEVPLSNLYLTMLKRLGVPAEEFGGSTQTLDEV